MVALELIQTLFNYHYDLWERVWESILTLSEAQFQQPVGYSHGSLHHQMLHAAVVDKRWLLGIKGDLAARHFQLNPADYPTRPLVKAVWDATAGEMQAYITALDEDILASKPARMSEPVWQILLHVANHGTDHRAQILRILHDFEAPTFDQDFIIYLWSTRHG
jgi:uncharacterized damage-inducible protein DinB